MTTEEMHIAVCEWMGWKRAGKGIIGPPMPTLTLDWLRDVAMRLKKDRLKYALFHKALDRLVAIGNSIDEEHSWMTADATKEQRLEALWTTLQGKKL